MKKIYRAMAGFFLAALLAVGLASLFTTVSGTDGASTKKPEFSMQALLDGTFISQLETYYANTFPMRDTLLKANRWLNGFYYSSAGDDNILVLGGNTGAEQGGESLARQEYEKTGQTLENEPSSAQESSGDADIPGDVTGTEETLPENQNGDTQTPPEEATDAPEEETIPELDNPDISEAQYAGNVVIVGNRAMEIPTATDSVIESYAKTVNALASALGKDVRTISLVTPNGGEFYSPESMHQGLNSQKDMIDYCYSQMNSSILTVDAYSKLRAHTLKERRNESNSALAQIGVVDTDTFESQHTDLLNVALEDLNGKRDTLQHEIDLALQKQRETKSRKNSDLKNLIYRFKNPAEEITMKYHDWRSDVSRLPEAVEFMGEYQAYYQRLLDEDLPGFESRFNKYLQENIINKVSAFNVFFQNWCQSITKTIDQLNSYLIGIDFKDAPKTYIQLVATKRLNVDVKEFQNLLSSAIPNIHEMNSTIDGSKIHFEQHIEPLMSRLQVESWRKSVMDVRGWYTYKSEEFYQDDGQKRNTYEAMGQLSGGEKAQLTYTILGSAIAYQFGLTKSGLDSSFRFIAIDEAFRAQDEDKARYLISLCKQLHLQLLVVTPSDNIHIVENDISYVHYVERKGNCSVLYNMPISEFKAERERSMEV